MGTAFSARLPLDTSSDAFTIPLNSKSTVWVGLCPKDVVVAGIHFNIFHSRFKKFALRSKTDLVEQGLPDFAVEDAYENVSCLQDR